MLVLKIPLTPLRPLLRKQSGREFHSLYTVDAGRSADTVAAVINATYRAQAGTYIVNARIREPWMMPGAEVKEIWKRDQWWAFRSGCWHRQSAF